MHWLPFKRLGLSFLAGFTAILQLGSAAAAAERIDFQRQVRPILADKCFKCHGPDAGERKGKLRLDTGTGAAAPAASGSVAIVAGKLDESELYQRITSTDPDERMPPPKSGKEDWPVYHVPHVRLWTD